LNLDWTENLPGVSWAEKEMSVINEYPDLRFLKITINNRDVIKSRGIRLIFIIKSYDETEEEKGQILKKHFGID